MKRVTTEDLREDLDGNDNTAPLEVPEVDMPDEQLPAAAVDATSDLEGNYSEIDDVDTGIDTAVDAQGQIAELKQTVEENGEDGKSLSATEELSVNVAMESIYGALGYTWAPSTMEGVTYRKRRETVVATLESAAGNLMEKVATGFKKAMSVLVDFLMNLLRNNWVLKKYIESIRKKVKALGGKQPTEHSMPESAAAMSIDGKAGYESVNELYITAMRGLTATEKAIEHVNYLNFKFKDEGDGKVDMSYDPGTWAQPRKTEDGETFGFLTNGRTYVPNHDFDRTIGVSSIYKEIRSVGEKAFEAEVLNESEMTAALKKAEEIVNEIGRVESKKSTLKNIASRIVQFTAHVASIYPSAVSKSAREFGYNLSRISGVRKLLNSIISRMPLEAFKTAKALTDYVRHSLKYYGEKTEEPKNLGKVETDDGESTYKMKRNARGSS